VRIVDTPPIKDEDIPLLILGSLAFASIHNFSEMVLHSSNRRLEDKRGLE